jgi:hypothetical protein
MEYVTFDSNAYRGIGPADLGKIQELERLRGGTTPVASPIVLLELVSKLASLTTTR